MKEFFEEVDLSIVELVSSDVVTESDPYWAGQGGTEPGYPEP